MIARNCFLFIALLLLPSCEEDVAVEKQHPTVWLTIDDVSCTEAWLRVVVNISTPPYSITLSRDGEQVFTASFLRSDTIVVDTGLSPNRTYRYTALLGGNSPELVTSEPLDISTMDSTSHDFHWTIDTVGTEGSVLRDVAFVGNEIWAVGTILVRSTGQLSRYNLARYVGNRWEQQAVLFPLCDDTGHETGAAWIDAISINAMSQSDVWIAERSSLVHWNGSGFIRYCLLPGYGQRSVSKVWGNEQQVVLVGSNGFVATNSGQGWTQLPTGTTVDLTDVWGTPDGSIVWACGWNDFQPTVLLRIAGGSCEKVYEDESHLNGYRPDGFCGGIRSVWSNRNDRLYGLTWYGLFEAPDSTHGEARQLWDGGNPSAWVSRRVRGNGINDLIAVGEQGRIWHYNGISWRSFESLVNPRDELLSVAIRGDLAVAVGRRYYNGVQIIGVIYQGRR